MPSFTARALALPSTLGLSRLLLAVVATTFSLIGFGLISDTDLLLDEKFHYPRVESIRDDTPPTVRPASNLHTYHTIVAHASRVFGVDTVAGTRLLSLLLSLLSIPIAFRIANKLDPDGASLTTAQYFFLPVLFPFFFLVYTDSFALLFVLLGLMFALEEVPWAAVLASFAAVLVRQPNVIWMGFFFLLPYVRVNGLKVSVSAIRDHLRRYWPFLIGFAAFVAFVAINKGVAVGDRKAHPDFQLRPDNVWFALFLVGVLFLPLHVSNLPRIAQLLRERPWWLLLLGAAFCLFWYGTRFDHFYNTYDYCLHNNVLNRMRSSNVLRVLFFVAVAGSALSLAVTPMKESQFFLLYPVAILSLVPIWMVDVRYALPALTLFTLFRVRRSWGVEGANLVWTMLLSIVLLEGMSRKAYFL